MDWAAAVNDENPGSAVRSQFQDPIQIMAGSPIDEQDTEVLVLARRKKRVLGYIGERGDRVD